MADVIQLQPKQKKEPLFWGHNCANFLFKLRDDGRIVCDKCNHEIGYWTLNGYDYPERPL